MTKETLKEYISQIKPDRWDCDILCELIDVVTDEDLIEMLEKKVISLEKAEKAKEDGYKLGYIQGYSDCEVKMKPTLTIRDLE